MARMIGLCRSCGRVIEAGEPCLAMVFDGRLTAMCRACVDAERSQDERFEILLAAARQLLEEGPSLPASLPLAAPTTPRTAPRFPRRVLHGRVQLRHRVAPQHKA